MHGGIIHVAAVFEGAKVFTTILPKVLMKQRTVTVCMHAWMGRLHLVVLCFCSAKARHSFGILRLSGNGVPSPRFSAWYGVNDEHSKGSDWSDGVAVSQEHYQHQLYKT